MRTDEYPVIKMSYSDLKNMGGCLDNSPNNDHQVTCPNSLSFHFLWHGNPFRITGTLWGESTGRWSPDSPHNAAVMRSFAVCCWQAVEAGDPVIWHDDVIKWKHFPRHWPFVRGIHRSPVNSPHKGQWHGALMFSLISAWIHDWVNTREAGDMRHHCAHYDVTVMEMNTQVASLWCVLSGRATRHLTAPGTMACPMEPIWLLGRPESKGPVRSSSNIGCRDSPSLACSIKGRSAVTMKRRQVW